MSSKAEPHQIESFGAACLATVGVQQQEQIFGGDAKPSLEHTPGFVEESEAEQCHYSRVCPPVSESSHRKRGQCPPTYKTARELTKMKTDDHVLDHKIAAFSDFIWGY